MLEPINPYTQRIKLLFDKYFNFKDWIDLKRTKEISNYFLNIFKKFFVPQKINQAQVRAFDDVVKEMGLTEEDISKKFVTFKRMYRVMLFSAVFFYVYSLYEILYGGILAVMVAVVLAFVCLALAFRYHFWYFQVKKRKLGCSIKDWFRESFMDGGR